MTSDPDLFGDVLPAPVPVEPVILHAEAQWQRIALVAKPPCGHCTMLVHYGREVPVFKARWTRVGKDGSSLDLCDGHQLLQRGRDESVDLTVLDQRRYEVLREAIIATMDDPSAEDGDEDEAVLLAEYVMRMSTKLHDINFVLDRDMT